ADEPTGNLDSKNTEEIMNLFTRLNKEMGISIIMVTHEPDVAEYSDRKVLFKDGQIVDDSPVVKSTKKKNLIKRKI
ncbi:MAG TPA: macrolide ABC transporter ATP-binding protein, partial [Spirochaetota bacterium]|nr:macrolide ABC transporter ATP-binding protein [Spirochaetota bacterium]